MKIKTIRAVELPENSSRIFIEHENSYGDKVVWYWNGVASKAEYLREIEPEQHCELLGVIQNGEIPEKLAKNCVKREYTQLGTMYLDDSGKRHSSPERALRQIFINEGIDLSKTVAIIKIK